LIGFLLPWSDAVVGAKSFGGYTDSWGLAVPSHVLVMLLLGTVLTLAVMPTRVPSWIRTGVLGVLTGGLLAGLAWPYLIGGLGASLGILCEAVAAALLIAGGVVERRAARHGGVSHSV
jgi:outer membrane lipoprotein SlyB